MLERKNEEKNNNLKAKQIKALLSKPGLWQKWVYLAQC